MGIESTRGEKTLERERVSKRRKRGRKGSRSRREVRVKGKGRRVKAEDIRNGITNVS